MTTYLIEYTETLRYRVEIEADDEDAAREAFWADYDDVLADAVEIDSGGIDILAITSKTEP
jgi:hypothetical protein